MSINCDIVDYLEENQLDVKLISHYLLNGIGSYRLLPAPVVELLVVIIWHHFAFSTKDILFSHKYMDFSLFNIRLSRVTQKHT